MNFQINIDIQSPNELINVGDKIFLIGSCFSEHIGARFRNHNWPICENPNGILFNPLSIQKAIERIVNSKLIFPDELIINNELWHHWDFHSTYSDVSKQNAVNKINASINNAHQFLKEADWVIITLGTAFQYIFEHDNYAVANCHRVPANKFTKSLISINQIQSALELCYHHIRQINTKAKFILTISPVRHIKDGIIQNNRSKARLIEAVQYVATSYQLNYFPSYEILIDVLRDYRFYDADLVHPNYASTQYIWDQLVLYYFSNDAKAYLKEMIALEDAFKHRPRFPNTNANKLFLKTSLEKSMTLQKTYPNVDLSRYLNYFEEKLKNLK